jgi:hypothetical protein
MRPAPGMESWSVPAWPNGHLAGEGLACPQSNQPGHAGQWAFAAEVESEKARQRTYDTRARKARALQVTDGNVYGYDNLEVLSPEVRRLRVVRRINPGQAVIVSRIFEMCGGGWASHAWPRH